jgi:hypothetical protein
LSSRLPPGEQGPKGTVSFVKPTEDLYERLEALLVVKLGTLSAWPTFVSNNSVGCGRIPYISNFLSFQAISLAPEKGGPSTYDSVSAIGETSSDEPLLFT